MKYFIFLTLLSSNLFARSEECREMDFSDKLMTFVSAQNCPTDDVRILNEVEDEYKKNFGNKPQTTGLVAGKKLSGSKEEIRLANQMLGTKLPKEWKDAVASCDSVICAFTNMTGSKESAMQLMNINTKSKYYLSFDQKINGGLDNQIWSPNEIREIDAALSKLPPELIGLRLNKFQRVADNLRLHNHGPNTGAYAYPKIGSGEAELVVYDTGMKGLPSSADPYKGTSWPQEAVIHELCHHHDFKGYYESNFAAMTSEKKNSVFAKLSGWKEETDNKGKSKWVYDKDAKFVSTYAQTNPGEDYAESCMNYVLHPDKLQEKSPEKYAYMKENLFNGKEFHDKSWVKGVQADWPELAELVKDNSECAQKLAECTKNTTMYFFYNSEGQLNRNECFMKYKNDRLSVINDKLGSDPKYCEMGGANAISRMSDNLCGDVVRNTGRALEIMEKFDFTNVAAECESKNDFSEACLIAGIPFDKLPEEMLPNIPKILGRKFPNRMKALGNKADQFASNEWLRDCLSEAKQITVSKNSNSSWTTFKDQKGKVTQLGSYLYDDYNQDDMNRSCSVKAIQAFKKDGVKVPVNGYPANVMQKPMQDEIKSFITEVLSKMNGSEKKTLELLKDWESKQPARRMGIATDEFAKELKTKVKVY